MFNDPKLPVIAMCNELEAKFIELCDRNEYERVLKLGNRSDDSSEEFDGEESKRSIPS